MLEFEVGNLVQNATTLTDEICAKSHFSETRWITESSKFNPNQVSSSKYCGLMILFLL